MFKCLFKSSFGTIFLRLKETFVLNLVRMILVSLFFSEREGTGIHPNLLKARLWYHFLEVNILFNLWDKSAAGFPRDYAHKRWEYSGLLCDCIHAFLRVLVTMSSKIHGSHIFRLWIILAKLKFDNLSKIKREGMLRG